MNCFLCQLELDRFQYGHDMMSFILRFVFDLCHITTTYLEFQVERARFRAGTCGFQPFHSPLNYHSCLRNRCTFPAGWNGDIMSEGVCLHHTSLSNLPFMYRCEMIVARIHLRSELIMPAVSVRYFEKHSALRSRPETATLERRLQWHGDEMEQRSRYYDGVAAQGTASPEDADGVETRRGAPPQLPPRPLGIRAFGKTNDSGAHKIAS